MSVNSKVRAVKSIVNQVGIRQMRTGEVANSHVINANGKLGNFLADADENDLIY